MASSFAAQLNEIAVKTRNELDLKAQKTAHSQSLIFEKKIAGSQDFATIYQLCLEGFEDLCMIDSRFREYQRNLFSETSKTQERDQMTADQNAILDTVIEAFLGLLGGRLLLSPAIKGAEWLIRRFRVHEYNTSFLLLTFLPYHATPVFRNLLSILPSQLPPYFKLLGPYIATVTNPPRHAIAYGVINNDGLFAAFNGYALKVCRAGNQHQTLLSFWASITAEAVAGRLDLARSGRKEIQRQRQEDVLLKLLPLLRDGLSMHDSSEMVVACFTLAIILATKSQLADNVLDSLMDAVTGALGNETIDAGLICLAILTEQKSDQSVPRKTVMKMGKLGDIETRLKELNKGYKVEVFALRIIQSALLNMKATDQKERLALVERLLFAELLSPSNVIVVIAALLRLLGSAGLDAVPTFGEVPVAGLLQRLIDTNDFSSVIADAVTESGIDPAIVEQSLQVIIAKPESVPTGLDEMDVDSKEQGETRNPLDLALQHVPECTEDEHTFLSLLPPDSFQPLLGAFTLAAQNKEGLQLFLALPLWRSADPEEPLFASFFIRVFSGPYAIQVRHAALSALAKWLSELSDLDSQAILPYVLAQLADPGRSIRKAASELLLAMGHSFPSELVDGEPCKQWAAKDVYGSGNADLPLAFVATKDVSKIIRRAVLPALEECVLDSAQIKRVLEIALKPNSNSDSVDDAKTPPIELKKYLRQGFFRLMLMHLLSTPFYSIKVGLLKLLLNVDRVGGVRKRTELMPLLLHWASLTPDEVARIEVTERLDRKHISSAMCGIVSTADSDAVTTLLSLTSTADPMRTDLASAVVERIRTLWPQLKAERQISAADGLLDLIFHDQEKKPYRSQISRDLFQSLKFSTDVLVHLLNSLHSSVDAVTEHAPVSKRRRDNEHQVVAVNTSAPEALLAAIRKATFVLELVDTQNPEHRPQLLSGLFKVLVVLHQLKLQHQSELSYLLSLSLGSLLSIVRQAVLHASEIDLSVVRLDVIIDCMRVTPNSHVQNTALLLIGALAGIAPERVLDSIMPVFTFMGATVLGKNDEYTSYVVDQIMDKVIPPLIESLRRQGQDVMTETSNLMLSFAVAYEHIPQHRRLHLFRKLVSNLGEESFLAVLITSLTQRYADQNDVVSFIVTLSNTFEVKVQLKACVDLMVLVQNAIPGQPSQQMEFEDASGNLSPATVSVLLRTLDTMLRKSNIRSKIAYSDRSVKNETDSLKPFWKQLLEGLIHMLQTPGLNAEVSTTINHALTAILDLVSMVDFIDIAEYFVDVGPEILKQRVLRLLESRLHSRHERSLAAQIKAITFLQKLLRLLKESGDEILMLATIACVDQICEIYGRKDITAVVEAARVLSSDNCLGSVHANISTLALLCLSSIIELVKDAIVPVVPRLMSKAFGLLQSSLKEGSEDPTLHNATFSLISTLLANVPFIISENYLDHIMMLSAESRNCELDLECHEIREQTLKLIDKNIDVGKIIGSLQRTWATTIENDVSAVQQALSLLTDSVKASPKSVVVKNSDKLCGFLLQAFDLRRIQFTNRTEDSYTDTGVSEIEDNLNSVAIEFIYKLSDTTFRPIFLRFVEWATKCQDVKPSILSKAQKLRQTTLFNFLAHFFNTLKSIVTSYATHFVEPAVAVLKDISSSTTPTSSTTSKRKRNRHPSNPLADQDTLSLYQSTLLALSAALTHDQDAHFSNPSLFNPLASSLVAQLHLAPQPSYAPYIFPSSSSSSSSSPSSPGAVITTIVALATAVVDTPDHLKTLNSLICGLRRAESAKTRLASVLTQSALVGLTDGGEDAGGPAEVVGIAEEWCQTVLSVGEGMVYVNEMLEDEDEEVERRVRRLVRKIREVVGEEGIFE